MYCIDGCRIAATHGLYVADFRSRRFPITEAPRRSVTGCRGAHSDVHMSHDYLLVCSRHHVAMQPSAVCHTGQQACQRSAAATRFESYDRPRVLTALEIECAVLAMRHVAATFYERNVLCSSAVSPTKTLQRCDATELIVSNNNTIVSNMHPQVQARSDATRSQIHR